MPSIDHVTVVANGVSFHVAVSGPAGGPDLLCLHGFPEGWMSWRAVMEELHGVRVHAPDLRGYPNSTAGANRFDIFTLTDDVKALIDVLGLDRPILVGHDWGAELAWVFAHRYSTLISRLVVINGTHPKTLVRAILKGQALQALRVPWVYFFEVPRFPEYFMTTPSGRRLLRWAFLLREGTPGAMDRPLVDELVARFRVPEDLRGPIGYYRAFVAALLSRTARRRLADIYRAPITVPVTAIWGLEDGALPIKIAMASGDDAGIAVDWRPLVGVGHFVSLEAPARLASELARVSAAGVAG
jgi:pimeloyl-ACP methyl ester carboxylesterase